MAYNRLSGTKPGEMQMLSLSYCLGINLEEHQINEDIQKASNSNASTRPDERSKTSVIWTCVWWKDEEADIRRVRGGEGGSVLLERHYHWTDMKWCSLEKTDADNSVRWGCLVELEPTTRKDKSS